MVLEVKTVLEFLRSQKYYQSLFVLEQESKCSLNDYSDDLDYIYRLITQGLFEKATAVLQPISGVEPELYKSLAVSIQTQELLEKINSCSCDVEEIVFAIKNLSVISDQQLIESLHIALKSNDLANFNGWSLWKGRLDCWEQIYTLITVEPTEKKRINDAIEVQDYEYSDNQSGSSGKIKISDDEVVYESD